MGLDHVALEASELPQTVRWYVERFGAEVLYEDETWAFLKLGNTKLALVTPGQHPAHLAFAVPADRLAQIAAQYSKSPKPHRDGTSSVYIEDPSGNPVELITYPEGHAYGKS